MLQGQPASRELAVIAGRGSMLELSTLLLELKHANSKCWVAGVARLSWNPQSLTQVSWFLCDQIPCAGT
eukprot:662386-Amphidinium_carterae.1